METWEMNDFGELPLLQGELAALADVRAPASVIPAVMAGVGLGDGYFAAPSPIGRIFVAYNDKGVSAVSPAGDRSRFETEFQTRTGRRAYPVEVPPGSLARAVEARLGGRRVKMLFDLRGLSDFEQAVLRKALEIPRGEVRPYAWIAAEIGHPRAVRAAGTALAHNPVPLLIPCHRVVRSDGRTGNYALGAEAKRAILQAEGARPDELDRLAAAGLRYYGSNTTRIFCYPTCGHAQRISEGRRVAFKSGAEAAAAGYRACRVCRPAEAVA